MQIGQWLCRLLDFFPDCKHFSILGRPLKISSARKLDSTALVKQQPGLLMHYDSKAIEEVYIDWSTLLIHLVKVYLTCNSNINLII